MPKNLSDSERKNLCPIQQADLIIRRKEAKMRSRSFPSDLPIEFYLSACSGSEKRKEKTDATPHVDVNGKTWEWEN